MDNVFLSLAAGSRLKNYMGLEMDPGVEFRYSPQYIYVEIPLGRMYNVSEGATVQKAMRNQHVLLSAACSVLVRGKHSVLVEPNPALGLHGMISGGMYLIHPGPGTGERVIPEFYMTLRRDMDQSDVDWAVRLYLIP